MTGHARPAALADALERLDELVPRWVDTYKAGHPPIEVAAPSTPVDLRVDQAWREAFGDVARMPDWELAFAGELQAEPCQEILQRWVPRLLDGYAGDLTHGLLRTAHAVRMLPSDAHPDVVAALAARAVDHGDVHLVTFTAACLREFALSPDPVYLRAAERIQHAVTSAG